MGTFLAYVIVILIAPYCSTFGIHISGILIGCLLLWLPDKVRIILTSLLSGGIGSLAAVGFGYLVFRLLVGTHSFGLFPFLAVVVPVGRWIMFDFKKNRDMKEDAATQHPLVAQMAVGVVSASIFMVIGQLIGLVAGCYLFVVR